MTAVERIRAALEPIVHDLGVELYDLELQGGALRVTLDEPGGISLDTLTEATRQFSGELDLLDPIDGRYTLEVSSPGLERVLRLPDHWRRAVGERVKVKTRVEIDGTRRFEGTLVGADDTGAQILVDGRDEPLVVDYSSVDRAKTAFEWGPTPKPGAKQPAGGAGSKSAKKPAAQAAKSPATNESEPA